MNATARRSGQADGGGTTLYEFRVHGRLDPATLASMGRLRVDVEPAETLLRGEFDASGVRSMLNGLQDLGLELVALRQLSGSGPGPGEAPQLYDIRVRGGLDSQSRAALDPVRVAADEDLLVLVCRADDQAQLVGLIDLIRVCGLELVEIRPHASSA